MYIYLYTHPYTQNSLTEGRKRIRSEINQKYFQTKIRKKKKSTIDPTIEFKLNMRKIITTKLKK